MKKDIKKRVIAGGLLTLSTLLSGCDDPSVGTGLYGPPRETPFDPGTNIVEDVYGPPYDYLEQSEDNSEQDFDPSEILPAPVYGPPSDQ